jgi:hypothetical protein
LSASRDGPLKEWIAVSVSAGAAVADADARFVHIKVFRLLTGLIVKVTVKYSLPP